MIAFLARAAYKKALRSDQDHALARPVPAVAVDERDRSARLPDTNQRVPAVLPFFVVWKRNSGFKPQTLTSMVLGGRRRVSQERTKKTMG